MDLSEYKYSLGVFIDLPKSFAIVNHQILPSKLNICFKVIFQKENNVGIKVDKRVISLQDMTRGVSQVSILRPVLFLSYRNDHFIVKRNEY